jgi:hypothetical protein
MIYKHLLTWVGFGLIAYVPNTLYITPLTCIFQFTIRKVVLGMLEHDTRRQPCSAELLNNWPLCQVNYSCSHSGGAQSSDNNAFGCTVGINTSMKIYYVYT